MNTSFQHKHTSITANSVDVNERSERFEARMKILKGLAQSQETLRTQRVQLTAALFRASVPSTSLVDF